MLVTNLECMKSKSRSLVKTLQTLSDNLELKGQPRTQAGKPSEQAAGLEGLKGALT